jgi:hypothetical protein
MELGNAVPASEVHDWAATVSLIIPSNIENLGNQGGLWHESFSMLLGVINLSLNTALSRDGFSTQGLNPSALELPEIPVLTIKEADKEPKIELNKIV